MGPLARAAASSITKLLFQYPSCPPPCPATTSTRCRGQTRPMYKTRFIKIPKTNEHSVSTISTTPRRSYNIAKNIHGLSRCRPPISPSPPLSISVGTGS